MDIERTMEFILRSQARAEVRMDRAEQRMDRSERRSDRIETRLDANGKLMRQGMRMLVRLDSSVEQLAQEVRGDIKELARAQKETQKTLTVFIRSFNQRSNGRGKH